MDLLVITFHNKEDAEEVLNYLMTQIKEHGFATVADYTAIAASSISFKDTLFGWSSLDGVKIIQVNNPEREEEEWLIDLPKPEQLFTNDICKEE